MGFFLSILYFVTYYLTPATIFGSLADYRIELIIAALLFFVSLPALNESFIFKTPQSLALIGLGAATFFSVVFGMHWPGGGLSAFLGFIPNAFAYFLVCLHCNSIKRLRILVLILLLICLFVIAHGAIDLQHTVPVSVAQAENGEVPPENISPYLLGMANDSLQWFYRLKGQGQIDDPNDFAQLIVCVLPLVFIFWTPKKMVRNLGCVIAPVCVLLCGAYLTHSRGSILALLAMTVVAARRRIGTLPSLLLAVGVFVGASALHFTGGREISADAGQDRLDLWGQGLQLFRAYPFFGVGFGTMADHAGKTAHNSIVVCAAELGTFGLYFWALFLFPTMRDILTIASPAKVSEGEPIVPENAHFPQSMGKMEEIQEIDKTEINRLGRLLFLSLTGFLVTSWFLSRAFILTLFLLGGIAEVVFEIALQRGMVSPRLPLACMLRYAAGFTILLLVLTYVVLRIGNVMR
jgi:hypothetical protein